VRVKASGLFDWDILQELPESCANFQILRISNACKQNEVNGKTMRKHVTQWKIVQQMSQNRMEDSQQILC